MEDVINAIREFCEMNECKFMDNYSGRYMYGKKCIGIIVNENPLICIVRLADWLHEEFDGDNASDLLADSIGMDNLGLDTIIYFPLLSID